MLTWLTGRDSQKVIRLLDQLSHTLVPIHEGFPGLYLPNKEFGAELRTIAKIN